MKNTARKSSRPWRIHNIAGLRFGRLIAIKFIETGSSGARWLCKCDCGQRTIAATSNLRGGHTISCGCFQKERAASAQTKHGLSHSRAYRVWSSMRTRCENPKAKQFADYGGRGIKVCERWKSFDNFYADMGDPPHGKTLERKDNDGDYRKENCRWATRFEQCRNKRNNRVITANGRTHCVAEWAEITGININTLWSRLKHGWNEAAAVTTPVHRNY